MSARILLVAASDPRRRVLEDLLADGRTVVRELSAGAVDVPWSGPAPDLLVVGAFGRTADAAELVRVALAAEPNLSILVVDEALNWPEALLNRPGVAVTELGPRGGLQAARERLLERRALLREVAARRLDPKDPLAAAALEGETPAVREMSLMLERVVEGQGSVVLAGEPGTLRRRILRHVLRSQDDLGVDSELMLVEDIDELAPPQQGSVLRLMQAGRRVVGTATPRFRQRLQDGAFRSDLYYRLGGQPVQAVPLRERRADVERLARACGLEHAGPAVLARLTAYDWPGNLRELELVVEHALMLARGGTVEEAHLALPARADAPLPAGSFVLRIPDSGVAHESIEREVIRQAMESTDHNVAQAARRLEVERGKLRYRLRKFGLGR
jgi:DNA-binding NtrC family response regulator